MIRQEHVKQLLETKYRRLQKLREAEAFAGLPNTDPKIQMEIEDLEIEIEALEEQLSRLASKETDPAPVLAPAHRPQVSKSRWPVIIPGFIALAVLAVGLVWVWSITVTAPLSDPDVALIDSFETDAASNWEVHRGNGRLSFVDDPVFAGRQALVVAVELVERNDQLDAEGTVQLLLKENVSQDRIAVARVYAPPDGPTNLFAGFFIVDANENWRSGPGKILQRGKWTTLVWTIRDAFPWESSANLGLQFTLTPGSLPTDQRSYNGSIYLDMVEVLEISANSPSPNLDRMVRPITFFDFETDQITPENITPIDDTLDVTPTDATAFPDGHRSLWLEVEFTAYDSEQEQNYGGVYVDLEGTEQVDALQGMVFVPPSDDSADGNFEAAFVAVDNEGGWVYSGGYPVHVGQWTPLFWGTRYAFSASNYCRDQNQDVRCDEPAGTLWRAWHEPEIKGFYVRIWRNGQGYKGPVYLDNLAVYRVTQDNIK